MTVSPAFTAPAVTSSFKGTRGNLIISRQSRPHVVPKSTPLRRAPRMADDGKQGFFSNPFTKKPEPQEPSSAFMEPQAGDPGYTPLAPVPKGFGMTKSDGGSEKETDAKDSNAGPKSQTGGKSSGNDSTKEESGVVAAAKGAARTASNLPVMAGKSAKGVKRGLDLLRDDLLRNAPERAGVGRQDGDAVTMRPVAGEPGYKPMSYQTVKVSELGISPFTDDANAVGKVGGIDAVKKAAMDAKKGTKAKEIKKALLSKKDEERMDIKNEKQAGATTVVSSASASPQPKAASSASSTSTPPKPKAFDIPDYLKAIPEDTPRKGMTWKNYIGR